MEVSRSILLTVCRARCTHDERENLIDFFLQPVAVARLGSVRGDAERRHRSLQDQLPAQARESESLRGKRQRAGPAGIKEDGTSSFFFKRVLCCFPCMK